MADESRTVMYGYWLSSCTWRVRAALYIKGIPYEERGIDIIEELSQLTEEYRAINPSQKVPSLKIDGVTLVESMAIVQYLEDTRPEKSLMPKSPLFRAQVREIVETIVSGIQPLQNLGLKPQFETEQEFLKFAMYWTKRGLQSLEDLLGKSAGKFCVGDQITIADLCLVPQIYNAVTRYDKPGAVRTQGTKENPNRTWREMLAEEYPTVSKVYDNLMKEEVFIQTQPNNIKSKVIQ